MVPTSLLCLTFMLFLNHAVGFGPRPLLTRGGSVGYPSTNAPSGSHIRGLRGLRSGILEAIRATGGHVPSRAFVGGTGIGASVGDADDVEAEPDFFIGATLPKVESPRFPYVVSLVERNVHICGGVLIGPKHVLTAAHCLRGRQISRVQVNIGGTLLHKPVEVGRAFKRTNHPKFRSKHQGNDLAVIELSSAAASQPVKLPEKQTDIEGEHLTGLGFGRNSVSGGFADLHTAELPYVPHHNCPFSRINRGMMCLGGNGSDSCDGDEGAPVILRGNDITTDVLMGITSFRVSECGTQGSPGIYTRVDEYISWLSDYI